MKKSLKDLSKVISLICDRLGICDVPMKVESCGYMVLEVSFDDTDKDLTYEGVNHILKQIETDCNDEVRLVHCELNRKMFLNIIDSNEALAQFCSDEMLDDEWLNIKRF